VDKGEKFVRVDVVARHQPAQGCAMLAEIAPPQLGRRVHRHLQPRANELGHAALDLVEQPAGRRVQRVVEIEDPGLDLTERAAFAPGGVGH